MNLLCFKGKLKKLDVFSISDINIIDEKFNRNQLTYWLKKGYIRKLKKGYYFFSDTIIDESFLYKVANKIYSSSYISMELALSRYGFIPENVYGITSVSARKTKTIVTEIGKFIYRSIMPELMFGYKLESTENNVYKFALAEKALLDFLYFNVRLNKVEEIHEMRFNIEEIKSKVDLDICDKYLKIFNSKSMNSRFNKFKEYIYNA
jgi:predicted transcriptional regulator of viral defense system